MITHPLEPKTMIQAHRKKCSCRGGGVEPVIGKILKVIPSAKGYWYYLDVGITIHQDTITKILS